MKTPTNQKKNKQNQLVEKNNHDSLANTLAEIMLATFAETAPAEISTPSHNSISRSILPSSARIFTSQWATSLLPCFELPYSSVAIIKTYAGNKSELSFIGEGNQSSHAMQHYHRFIASFSWKRRQFFREQCSFLSPIEKTNLSRKVLLSQRGMIDQDELISLINEKSNILNYIKLHSLTNNIVNTAYKPLLL